GGVVHSFTGTYDEMKELVDLGFYIGVNGCSLKTDENLEVVREIPNDRLLLETDAPWCEIRRTHASYKFIDTHFESKKKEKYSKNHLVNGRNEPCKMVQVLEVVAKLKEMNAKDLSDIVYENTMKLFPML